MATKIYLFECGLFVFLVIFCSKSFSSSGFDSAGVRFKTRAN